MLFEIFELNLVHGIKSIFMFGILFECIDLNSKWNSIQNIRIKSILVLRILFEYINLNFKWNSIQNINFKMNYLIKSEFELH
jgi:hypothetical protein